MRGIIVLYRTSRKVEVQQNEHRSKMRRTATTNNGHSMASLPLRFEWTTLGTVATSSTSVDEAACSADVSSPGQHSYPLVMAEDMVDNPCCQVAVRVEWNHFWYHTRVTEISLQLICLSAAL